MKSLNDTFAVSILFYNINNNLNIKITCDKKFIIFYILKDLGLIEKIILWKASMIDAFQRKKKFYEVLNEKIKELELDFQTNFGPSNRLFNQSRKPRHGPYELFKYGPLVTKN